MSSTPFSPPDGSGAFKHACVRSIRKQDEWSGSYLNEILAFCFGDQGLKLRCGECVDEAGLRNNKQEDLRAREDGELVCLRVLDYENCGIRGRLTFFMIPAFRLEKVM